MNGIKVIQIILKVWPQNKIKSLMCLCNLKIKLEKKMKKKKNESKPYEGNTLKRIG